MRIKIATGLYEGARTSWFENHTIKVVDAVVCGLTAKPAGGSNA
jgi:hypothetical protein